LRAHRSELKKLCCDFFIVLCRRRELWLLTAALLLCAWQICSFHSVRHDDPFITYRYGQNLANGDGMVFNPGSAQRILGATSPGHIFLSAIVHASYGTKLTPSIVAALGCVAWTVQAVVVYALLVAPLGPLAASAAALFVDLGAAESFKWVPFETNIAAAFALLALAAYRGQHHKLVGFCLALGTLFRPDVLLLVVLVFGDYLLRRSIALKQALATFLPPVAAWTAFAILYFGTAVPQSAVEKFHRTSFATYFEHAFVHVGSSLTSSGPNVWSATCGWLLCLGGAVVLSRLDSALRILSLYALAHLAAYTYIAPFVEHSWHLYPAVLSAAILSAGGLAWLVRRYENRLARVAGVLMLGGLLCGVALRSLREARDLPSAYWSGARDAAYQRVATYLDAHMTHDAEFAAIEVGTIAYYSGRNAYDLGGLVTDLRTDAMARHNVRFLVLDRKYLSVAPPWPPAYSATETPFNVSVYRMPVSAEATEPVRPRL
jgi:arabinofuranosyltransferase